MRATGQWCRSESRSGLGQQADRPGFELRNGRGMSGVGQENT